MQRSFRMNWIAAAITLPCLIRFSLLVTPGAGRVGLVVAGRGLGQVLHRALLHWVYRPNATP